MVRKKYYLLTTTGYIPTNNICVILHKHYGKEENMNYSVKEMEIKTSRLIIRPYKNEDFFECFELMQEKKLFKYLDMSVMSLDEYKRLFNWLIESYNVGFNEDFKYSFNITLKDNGQHIGWCGIGGLDFDHATKEIYYLIGKDYWGNDYAKEAAKALLGYAFNVMNLNEIVAKVHPENIASKKVIENMDMTYKYILSGLAKEFNYSNGELLYSITKDDYYRVTKKN